MTKKQVLDDEEEACFPVERLISVSISSSRGASEGHVLEEEHKQIPRKLWAFFPGGGQNKKPQRDPFQMTKPFMILHYKH